MSIDNDRLNKLKQFIIDKYTEERESQIITINYRIGVPIKTVCEIFNDNLGGSFDQLNDWLHKEFPNNFRRVYFEDRLHTDIYIEMNL